MRSLAELAQQSLGQPVVTENRPGASGTLHAQPLAAARPDGHTLGQMHLSVVRRPFLVRQPLWDTVADYTHILRLCGWMYGVAVKAGQPAPHVGRPRRLRARQPRAADLRHQRHRHHQPLGHGGPRRARGRAVHARALPGSSEGMTAVLSGQVDCIADSSVWVPQVEAGQMRALCVWSAERVPACPACRR
jgi:tripartite-type tricarboxylate transporter receptor subunit TctC